MPNWDYIQVEFHQKIHCISEKSNCRYVQFQGQKRWKLYIVLSNGNDMSTCISYIGKLWYAHTKGCFTLNHWCPCMLPWVSGRPQVPHDRSWRWAERRLCTADREPESGPSLRCSTMTQNPRLTSYLQLKPCESLTISWVLIFLISIVCGHKCISPMNCNVISSKHNIYFFLCKWNHDINTGQLMNQQIVHFN